MGDVCVDCIAWCELMHSSCMSHKSIEVKLLIYVVEIWNNFKPWLDNC